MKRFFLCCLLMMSCRPQDTEKYYGKYLYQLRQEDPVLNDVIEKAHSIIRYYKFFFFITSPSSDELENIQKSINYLSKITQEIENSLQQAQQKLKKLTKEKISILPENNPGAAAAGVGMLAPWLLLGALSDGYSKRKVATSIEIMVDTQKKLKKIITDLEAIKNL